MTIPMRMRRLQMNAQLNADKIKERREILDWALGEKEKLARLKAEKDDKEAPSQNLGSLSTSASCPSFVDTMESIDGTEMTGSMGAAMAGARSLTSLGAVSLQSPSPSATMFHSTTRPACTASVFSPALKSGKTFQQRVDLAKSIASRNAAEISYRRTLLDEKAAAKAREMALSRPTLVRGVSAASRLSVQDSIGSTAGRDALHFKEHPVPPRPLPKLYNDMLAGSRSGANAFKLEFSETLSQAVPPGLMAQGGSLKERLQHFENKAMWNSYAMARHRRDLQFLRAPP
eukprot:TRINITY_DN28862_c0_g1_i1.p1 TRINITY_DN28862_c0_g1~~TRINITY_DN28862_c0_g1_i1.p1  ORF type:complete len:288 (+),score=65.28 TRINITY_DN28862_c0_g1_i1:159-1022(+)